MPWLVGAALLHSQAATEKRGSFRGWTVLLAIAAFSLSLLGTFLVRSGVLTSVHAFAADPARGLFILIFLAIVIGGSLLLYALRAPRFEQGGPFAAASRETLLLANNLLLVSACGMVLLGTLYPLLADALGLGKISVGPPYFGFLFVLLMTPLVLLLPFGPLTRWQREQPSRPLAMLAPWAILALVLGVVAFFVAPQGPWKTAAGVAGAAWIFFGTARFAWTRLKGGRKSTRLNSRYSCFPAPPLLIFPIFLFPFRGAVCVSGAAAAVLPYDALAVRTSVPAAGNACAVGDAGAGAGRGGAVRRASGPVEDRRRRCRRRVEFLRNRALRVYAPEGQRPLYSRDAGHDPGAYRHRGVRRRRAAGRSAEPADRAGREDGPAGGNRRLRIPLRGRGRNPRPQLHLRPRPRTAAARRQTAGAAAPGDRKSVG